MNKQKVARLANLPMDYQNLKLKKEVALWEDGHRTNGKFGEYEWWYYDGRMDDGSSLVINFYTQPVTAAQPKYCPSMILSLTIGDELITDGKEFSVKDCSFSREKCDVRLGNSYFRGDLNTYEIHYETERIHADIKLTSSTTSWRPETGHFLFDEKYTFAWLPSVPEGKTEATVTVDGKTYHFTGTGYHDHNWGNIGMFWVMHHWYWGRAKIGNYQVISSYITAQKKYGYTHFPIFLLSKDGQRLGDDPKFLTYTQAEPEFDHITKKHYHKKLIYDYNDGAQHYRITYSAEKIIETFVVADAGTAVQAKTNPLLNWIVRSAGLAPSYIRMIGTVTLDRFEGEELVEHLEAPGLWEQMYFGFDEDV